ncbi:MAG: NAD-dependent epimerase/dehydratase family protein [Myxococcota bacterium]
MADRVFVTGAAGQIGLPLVRALAARGLRVGGLARDDAKAAAVREAGGEPVKGTLEDAAALAEGLRGARWVFHLAGGVRGRGKNTADVVNRAGTVALVEALRGHSPEGVVFASSCAVYGDRSGLWVPEDYPVSPMTKYGESKVAAEVALRGWGGPVRFARIAATYGPGFRFLLADQMRSGRAWLPGEGKNHVPVVHVDDCVAALVRIAEAGRDGEAYHVAGRDTPMLREFYAAVHARAGGKPVRFWSTWIPSGIQVATARANERIATRLGTKPRFTEDNLKLYTASVRLRTERLEKELGFTWRYGGYEEGVGACF